MVGREKEKDKIDLVGQYGDINSFTENFQPRITFAKDEVVNHLHIPTEIWTGGRIDFVSYLLYMELTLLDRLKYIQLSDYYLSLVYFELEIQKLKRYGLQGTDRIPAEVIETGGNLNINYILNKEKLPQQWKESVILPIYKKNDKTDCSNYQVTSDTNIYQIFCSLQTLRKNGSRVGYYISYL
jgi:hypothetical protein